jgi:hypothetical protein
MRSRFAVMLAILASLSAGVGAQGATDAERGIGFELKRTSITPRHPTFDAKREIRLHYGFAATRAADLRIEVRRAGSDKVVRVYRERDARPGRRLARVWNGLNRRDRVARDGRYEFRVGPRGGAIRCA